jgi:hypothetical protein
MKRINAEKNVIEKAKNSLKYFCIIMEEKNNQTGS